MTEFMPHAVTSDSHLLPWPRAPISHRTLPLPSNAYESAATKQVSYQTGPPTPPATQEMPYSLPQLSHHEVSYPVRPHVPASQSVVSSQKKPVESTTEKYIKSSPPGISNLVQGEPQGRQSPSHSSAITAAFKLPSSINAPQASLPQLAAEVRNGEEWELDKH